MKAPVIEIAHRSYLVKSIAKATELAKLLSELVEVEHRHSADYSKSWVEEVDTDSELTGLNVKLRVSVEVRKRPARLGLPAPKRGAIRCGCGRGTVLPEDRCPSCDATYQSILESRQ